MFLYSDTKNIPIFDPTAVSFKGNLYYHAPRRKYDKRFKYRNPCRLYVLLFFKHRFCSDGGKGELFRINATDIEYQHITYETKQGEFIADNLISKCVIHSVVFDYPTFIYLPLSPKRAMFLYSDTKNIPIFDPTDENMIKDLNIEIHAGSMFYCFSNIDSVLTDIGRLIKWETTD